MKVRIGFGLGNLRPLDGERLGALAEAMERHGFDSLWLSERITGAAPDPLIGLAVAAGRTRRLKLGTSVLVLPGRSPALLASTLASLDQLSGGRLLPAVGLGVVDPAEQQAFGVAREDRAGWVEEALPLLRRFWSGEAVTHDGPRFHYDGLTVQPLPAQSPPDVWFGGIAPSELRRTGRLGDGWLPSFCTPDDAAAARPVIEQAADEAGRAIDPEHFGALVTYVHDEIPERLARLVTRRRPDTDPRDIVPVGLPALRALLERFVERGFSKFVVAPVQEPPSWDDELAGLAEHLQPLQN
jgi:probable F420-dependent oxidoreductase